MLCSCTQRPQLLTVHRVVLVASFRQQMVTLLFLRITMLLRGHCPGELGWFLKAGKRLKSRLWDKTQGQISLFLSPQSFLAVQVRLYSQMGSRMASKDMR